MTESDPQLADEADKLAMETGDLDRTPEEIPLEAHPNRVGSSDPANTAPDAPENSAKKPAEGEPPKDEASETGFLPVLKNLNFLTLWGGQVFSQLADKVYLVLMIGLISSRFQAPDQSISGWVSAIMIAFTIPAILFGSIAGILVGRTTKQPVLVITNVLRGALVLSIPVLLGWVGNASAWGGLPLGFYLLLTITFLVSTLTQFFAPAEQAILPAVVENRLLLSANSLYTTTMMAATIVGFAIGEQVLNWAENLFQSGMGLANGNSIAVGISYILAGGLIGLMRVHEAAEETAEETHLWADIKDGVAFLNQNPRVRGAIVRLIVLFSVFAALAVLAVRVAEVIPNLETDQFGLLLSAGSVGLGLGAVLVGQFGQRLARAQLGLLGTVGMAVSLGILSLFTTQFWWAIATIAFFGFFAALLGIPAQTTIQEKTPPQMRGKIFGLQNNAVNIALSLPLALAGIAEQFVGLRLTLLSLAVLILVGNFSTWYFGKEEQEESAD